MDQVEKEINHDIWKVENYMKEGYTASEFTNQVTSEKKYFITVYVEVEGMKQPMADTVPVVGAKSLEEAFAARERLTMQFKEHIEAQIKLMQEEMNKPKLLGRDGSPVSKMASKAGLLV